MKSEELEQSLRLEFENYLKAVIAQMRHEANEFQTTIEAEFEKHKAGFNEAFTGYAARFDSEHNFDDAFKGTVAEHLKLARDEGARITADAMAEAEKLNVPVEAPEPPPPVVLRYDAVRDAVSDISSKDSQSAILKTLVEHAAEFAPRGAFFIIKNEHFAGWKVFGADGTDAETAVRDIHFAASEDSILAAAVKSRATVDGASGGYSFDAKFLDPLQFGQAEGSHAIPLIARGRGVAVLYVDRGTAEDADLNVEALETLVRVAGLTVELLASSQTAKAENRTVGAADFEDAQPETVEPFAPVPVARITPPVYEDPVAILAPAPAYVAEPPYTEPTPAFEEAPAFEAAKTFEHSAERPAHVEQVEEPTPGFAFTDSVNFEGGFPQETVREHSFDPAPTFDDSHGVFNTPTPFEEEVIASPVAGYVDDAPFGHHASDDVDTIETDEVTPAFEPVSEPTFEVESNREYTPFETAPMAEPVVEEYVAESPFSFDSNPSIDVKPATSSPFESAGTIELTPAAISPFDRTAVEEYEPAVAASGFGHVAEPVIEAPIATPTPSRLRDRPVDLPIEVPEEERRIHNDARRFARLLVSEIKLYNEKKVTEGREANDLYDRLREAIDRSREMYDKRVQPPVAAKFDYFHYELVNSLADGDASRLGSSYRGASV